MISWMYSRTQSTYSALLTYAANYYELFQISWYRSLIPSGAHIAYLGSRASLLSSLNPRASIMISSDTNEGSLAALTSQDHEPFDYIIVSAPFLTQHRDYKELLLTLRQIAHPRTRILIEQPTWWGHLCFGSKQDVYLSKKGLNLALTALGFTIVTEQTGIIIPFWIPALSWLCNSLLGSLPLFNRLGCLRLITACNASAHGTVEHANAPSVSVIIPCKNERGTVEQIIRRTPTLGRSTELLFVEGNSSDGTYAELQRLQQIYSHKAIRIVSQTGRGKRNATVEGCAAATGNILMILDGDMTVDPEELAFFYDALATNRGGMINGTRLCLPMEKGAMQKLNWVGNHTFAWLLTWITGQRLTDTLCGTKVFWKRDYDTMTHNNPLWNADPFGDFALLVGAARLSLRIVEVPVFYRARRYGTSQIHRFYNAAQLFALTVYAWKEQCVRW